MSIHHWQEITTAHNLVNNMWPPSQEQMDDRTALESASDDENWQNATAHHSLKPPPRNKIASKVDRALGDLILYEKIVSIIRDQAACIWELERNLQWMGKAIDERGHRDHHHRGRDSNEPY